MEKASKTGQPGLSNSEEAFEGMIQGMDQAQACNFFKEFLKHGQNLLSDKAKEYLLKRIEELTDKTSNEG